MKLSWFFDYISPFAYLQWKVWHKLPEGIEVDFYPVLFAGLLKHWEHKGPAEIPAKRDFTYRHIDWLAKREKISITFPKIHPFNPLRALRLTIALDHTPDVINTVFNFIWNEGRDINNDKEWQNLLSQLSVNSSVITEEVKKQLTKNCENAIKLGIFGVPSFIYQGEIFWGFDSTEMLIEKIQTDSMPLEDNNNA